AAAAIATVALAPAASVPDDGVAVAPEGRPLALQVSETMPELRTVALPELPWVSLIADGVTLMVTAGVALMVSVTLAVCVADAPLPVTVRLYVPAAALPALSVSVELPPAVTDVELNEPLEPDGRPATLSATD